jgi:hypothetical protein
MFLFLWKIHKRKKLMNMPVKENCKNKDMQMISKDEIMECDKHNLIIEISKMIDSENSSALFKAEKIFNQLKYSITHHTLKQEFGPAYYSNEDIYFQLEEKAHPTAVQELNSTIDKYLL